MEYIEPDPVIKTNPRLKTPPRIDLEFRGVKISKTLETAAQFRKCLEFLYEEAHLKDENIMKIVHCSHCNGTGEANA